MAVLSIQHLAQCCQAIWKEMWKTLLRTQHSNHLFANQHCRSSPRYTTGQSVWLFTKNIPLWVESRKLVTRFIGRFTVNKAVNLSKVRLNPPNHVHIHQAWWSSGLYILTPGLGTSKFLVEWEGYGPREKGTGSLGLSFWSPSSMTSIERALIFQLGPSALPYLLSVAGHDFCSLNTFPAPVITPPGLYQPSSTPAWKPILLCILCQFIVNLLW